MIISAIASIYIVLMGFVFYLIDRRSSKPSDSKK